MKTQQSPMVKIATAFAITFLWTTTGAAQVPIITPTVAPPIASPTAPVALQVGSVAPAGSIALPPSGSLPRPGVGPIYTDPTTVSLSGSSLTSEDIRLFDNRWMTQDQHDGYEHEVHKAFWIGYDPFGLDYSLLAWGEGERMAAMARMYDLTHAAKYLDELRFLTNLVLAGRDDHIDLQPEPASQFDNPAWQPNPASRMDGLRGGVVMPAWGHRSNEFGGYHTSTLDIAGVYAYPIAAFARIVAENPTLHATYGADARAATKDILEMLGAFRSELRDPYLTAGGENPFVTPSGYGVLLTKSQCTQAYQVALQNLQAGWAATGYSKNYEDQYKSDRQRFDKAYTECSEHHDAARYPLPHNQYQAFVMALIELSRALDTDLYMGPLPACQPPVFVPETGFFDETLHKYIVSPAHWDYPFCERSYVQGVARNVIPAIVAGATRYYRNRWLAQGLSSANPYFTWHYIDDNPSSVMLSHALDDLSHGALEMRYLGLVWSNIDRLNALLASSLYGVDKIDLSAGDMWMLANTFLSVLVKENTDANGLVHTHLASDLTGALNSPIDAGDDLCDGWLNLAQFNSLVYNKCETTVLHLWDPSIDPVDNNGQRVINPFAYSTDQPHLFVGIHSALLALKQFRK